MRMSLDRRLQILIDDARYHRLAVAARERGTSVAAVIRSAIDEAMPQDAEAKRAAWRTISRADAMPVPEPEDLKAELEEIRSGS
jgi:hypothetical protein